MNLQRKHIERPKHKRIPLSVRVGGWLLVSLFVAMGCANRGSGPQGGPKDETPPVLLRSMPLPNQTNVTSQRVVLEFDEIVLLDNPSQKVVVSPPQSTQPIVKAVSKKIYVQLPDSLEPNTTYTIDFTNSIEDNNEKNKLENFAIAFSTGDVIDSLQMSGVVLDASNLNPVADMIVGIHSDLSDSAFLTKRFERITKTDSDGFFNVKNIKPGRYRIYGLTDIGSNYLYDVPTEQIAFLDTIYIPDTHGHMRKDTIWKEVPGLPSDTVPQMVVDSIVDRGYTVFTPYDILMRAFTLPGKRQYLVRNEREVRHKFTIIFNTAVDSVHTLTPLNFSNDYILQSNLGGDTLTYWLKDSMDIKIDTLLASVRYRKTDSLGVLQWQLDTIRSIYRAPRGAAGRGRNKPQEEKKIDFIKISTNLSSKFDVYNSINLIFEAPTFTNDSGTILIEQLVDTIWKKVPTELERGDSIGMRYRIHHKWKPEATYRLTIDSATFHNLYGAHNNQFMQQFQVRSLEDYSKLILNLTPFTGKEVIQLLDKKDNPIRTIKAESSHIVVDYVEPGESYMRLFIDENGNGVWDPGNYSLGIQPEEVYYFPYTLQMRAFWDIEEEWNYLQTPLPEQKPVELISSPNMGK